MRMRNNFLIIFLTIAFSATAGAAANTFSSFTVDISSLAAQLKNLSDVEQAQQLQDWALFATLARLNEPDAASQMHPVRGENSSVGQGRTARLANGQAVVIISSASLQDKLLIGRLCDRETLAGGAPKGAVHIFTYSVDAASFTVTVAPYQTVSPQTIYSAAYGFTSKQITNDADIQAFLAQAQDIASADCSEGKLILGGRASSFGEKVALTLEDIEAVYQAYGPPPSAEQEAERKNQYERFLKENYDEAVKNDAKLRKLIKNRQITYQQIMSQIRKKIPYQPLSEQEVNIGFSLDPFFDCEAIKTELNELAEKTGRYAPLLQYHEFSALVDSCSATLKDTAQQVAKNGSNLPLIQLRQRFVKSSAIADMQMDRVLHDIEQANSYQAARYDGNLRGTHAGMILFYTDLTAKLWALDYRGFAPTGKVAGFRTMATIQVPRQQWDDFVRLSKTRLWFGLRDEDYDIIGDKLIFSPIATRVYAASSDPLFPGKETTPNYQSHEFLGWWDKHFEAIADFEPYYHRLNQLQKWGCLFTVLRTKNNRSLDFLMSPAVSHNQDFQLWYGSATDIISKTELPFVDKKKFNRDTECFSLLSSHGYPLMGQIYFISGGVSLASTKDILAKMNRHNGSEIAASGSKALLKNSTKKISKASRTSGAIEASGKEGALRATVSNRRVILSWKESEFSLMKSFVNSLVAIQDGKQEGYKSDGIFKRVSGIEKAVRLGEGKSYLIKTSAMKQWIRLSINKKEKGQEYSYTASGTEPDCDIFYSKTTPAPKTIQGAVIIP